MTSDLQTGMFPALVPGADMPTTPLLRDRSKKPKKDTIPDDPIGKVIAEAREEKLEPGTEVLVHGVRYKLVEILGIGGTGTTFRAKRADDARGDDVVVKIVPLNGRKEESNLLGLLDSNEAESDATQRIGHLIMEERKKLGLIGYHLLVRKFYEGTSLSTVMKNNPDGLKPAEACRIVLAAAKQLHEFATKHLFIHHDVKTGNMILAKDGSVVVTDFGLATPIDDDMDAPHRVRGGTENAVAPEHLENNIGSMKAQVYALGLLLLRLLGGSKRDPFFVAGLDGKSEDANAKDILALMKKKLPNKNEAESGLYGLLNTTSYAGAREPYLKELTKNWGRDAGAPLYKAFQNILHINPEKRMGIEELIAVLETVVKTLSTEA